MRDPASRCRRVGYPPPAGPPSQWPDEEPTAPGFEFGDAPAEGRHRAADPGLPDYGWPAVDSEPFDSPRPAGPVTRGLRRLRRAAGIGWPGPFPSRPFPLRPGAREQVREILAGLRLRGRTPWAVAAVLVSASITVGIFVSVNKGGQPHTLPASPGMFLPATVASQDFTPYAAGSTRGITESQGRVASAGTEVVAVAAETGQRVPRAEFSVSLNDGGSWMPGTVTAAGGGTPPPGHAARFVAGGQGEWVAIGPDSIWMSADGRTWTLISATGLPQLAGDHVSVLKRTASGFIAGGVNMPGGDQARATPVIFLSADGVRWQRLGAGQLHLPAGHGRALDVRLAAARGEEILIAGDVATPATVLAGRSRHVVTVRTGGAWLSEDGGRSWRPVSVPAGHGAQDQFTDAAATADGFLLVRPAAVDGVQAADVYWSGNGTAWAFAATLTTPAGFAPSLMNGGSDGAVIAGRSGRTLTAFVSADGTSWRQTPAFGSAASETVSGVAPTTAGAVIAVGRSTAVLGSSQRLVTITGMAGRARSVSLAAIPGTVEPQLAVNAVAAGGGTQVAVGSANGFPSAWVSVDGGRTWHHATGGTPAVLNRPGLEQLTSVTHGPAGWLAVGGVTGEAAEHPVVLVSAAGSVWSAVDNESVFAGEGLFTRQAAAGPGGYVIVGSQQATRTTILAGGRKIVSNRTIAAAWWSAGLTGWQRAGDATAGALDGAGGSRQMLAVTATSNGFVAVGSHGTRPAVWSTPDGRAWAEADLPLPAGATGAVLQHVVADGPTVVAMGTAQTAAGQVPFAARSADGGRLWSEYALPVPAGTAQVTALAAADGSFTATGTFGTAPGHQDVVVWTSPDGTTWNATTPAEPGLAGPGIQAITGLTVSGHALTGVGFTASSAGEQPILWRTPIP